MNPPIRPSLTNVYLVVGTAMLLLGTDALLGKEPLPLVGAFGADAPLIAVLMCLHKYARSRGISFVYDWGLLFGMAWFIVIPLYLVRLEGRRGWRLAALLVVLTLGPWSAVGVLEIIRAL